MMKNVLTVVGARPQFVKAAAVSRALALDGRCQEKIVHELGIPKPAHNLNISGGGHGNMTGRMMIALEDVALAEKPDCILVYGDTNSTLAGALVGAKLHIPVAHVEAGLRSFNRRMPEEINRIAVDHISSLLFCPTASAVANLRNEGLIAGVHAVGDVMFDATLFAMDKSRITSRIMTDLGLTGGEYDVATVHRAESTDDPARLADIVAWLNERAKRRAVVLPLHPRTRLAFVRTGLVLDGVRVIDPVGYLDMTRLLADCVEVYTDSGGLQKEAYFHRKLCTTLREETEWVETIEAGWNRLWRQEQRKPFTEISDYGNGNAAQHIVKILIDTLSR